jgi:hypothetical protein
MDKYSFEATLSLVKWATLKDDVRRLYTYAHNSSLSMAYTLQDCQCGFQVLMVDRKMQVTGYRYAIILGIRFDLALDL